MLGIHHQASRPTTTTSPDELGRVGWIVLGTSMLMAGAIAHALSGIVAIARELLRPAPQRAPTPVRPVHAADLGVEEKNGWILITVLFLLTGTMAHAVAHVVETIRQATRTTHGQVRA
ncbi:hypothetical protein ACFVUY_09070 [Kitasatospora sp. NPDC058063]|uniref:hypothetical protein n=1 Tax=unclassified Kitasatospora TaxID=2633591 RepID=UPI0036DAEB3D